MKISFDFDSTLAEERQQQIASKFIKDGHEVWITTSRMNDDNAMFKNWNKDVYTVAKILGIPRNRIQFCEMQDKWNFLNSFDMHFDDDIIEIELIEENLPNCACILILDP